MCEAMERCFAACSRATSRAAGPVSANWAPSVVHPNACSLYSDEQYRTEESGRRRPATTSVDERPPRRGRRDRLDPGLVAHREQRTSTCQAGHLVLLPPGQRRRPGPNYALGRLQRQRRRVLAGGRRRAGLHGRSSRRDAVALWWYNRGRPGRPSTSTASRDPWMSEFREVVRRSRPRHPRSSDLTTDLGRAGGRLDQPPPRRADRGRHDGLRRPLRRAHRRAAGARRDEPVHPRRHRRRPRRPHPLPLPRGRPGQLVEARPRSRTTPTWRRPDRRCRPRRYDRPATGDLLDDVATARALVEERGMEMLVLDQTRPDIGLPVVKVGRAGDAPLLAPGWRPAGSTTCPSSSAGCPSRPRRTR